MSVFDDILRKKPIKKPMMSVAPQEPTMMSIMSDQQIDAIARMPDVVKNKVKENLKKSMINEQDAPTGNEIDPKMMAGKMALQASGIKQDSMLGGGLNAALMTTNPYIIAGSAILGGLAGRSKRKKERRQKIGQAEGTKELAKQTAMQRMATGMSQALSRSGRRIKL